MAKKELDYRSVLEMSRDAVMIVSSDGMVIDCNHAAKEVFGCTAKGQMHRPIASLIPHENLGCGKDDLLPTIVSKSLWHNVLGRRRDGTIFPCEINAHALKGNDKDLIAIYIRDISEEARSQAALRESEEKFRALAENSLDVIMRFDLDYRHTYVNPAVVPQTGIPVAKFIGKTHAELGFPEYLTKLWEKAIIEVVATAQGKRIEFELPNSIWIDWQLMPEFGSDGKVSGVMTAARDITARKNAEAALRKANDELEKRVEERTNELATAKRRVEAELAERTRAEAVQAALFRITEEANTAEDLPSFFAALQRIVGELLYAKNFYIALYDPAKDEISFPFFVDTFDTTPDPRRAGRGLTEYVLRKGEPFLGSDNQIDDLIARGEVEKSGTDSVDWLGVPLNVHGEVIGVLAVQSYTDEVRFGERDRELLSYVAQHIGSAMQRKQATEELRDSEERFRAIYENSPVGIALMSMTDNRFLSANPAFVHMVGYSEDELRSRTPFEITHPDDIEAESKAAAYADEHHEQGFTIEKRYVNRSGQTIWVNLSGSIIRDVAGKPLFGLGIVENISERKRVEEQLLHAQKMEAVGRLAGSVAHDFNNLLQAMLSQLEVLRHSATAYPSIVSYTNELEQQIRRGAGVARQLLLFSRRETPKPQLVDLNEVLRGATTMLHRLVRENIAVSIKPSSEKLPIEVDHGQLDQVLLNLVVNAVDAMPERGHLTITSGREDNVWAWFSVTDDGTGIPVSIRDRIFEPFFTTKPAARGTGLGLSVVHGIVNQYGGWIEVISEIDQGSSFRIVFPIVDTDNSMPLPTSPATAPRHTLPSGQRILVVEDETGAREGLRDMLDLMGFRVTAVVSGEDAVIAAQDTPFDLLLTDYLLPGMKGTEVARTLRQHWGNLKVILMSGYAQEETVRLGVDQGEFHFLQKPFDMASLEREIDAALGSSVTPQKNGH